MYWLLSSSVNRNWKCDWDVKIFLLSWERVPIFGSRWRKTIVLKFCLGKSEQLKSEEHIRTFFDARPFLSTRTQRNSFMFVEIQILLMFNEYERDDSRKSEIDLDYQEQLHWEWWYHQKNLTTREKLKMKMNVKIPLHYKSIWMVHWIGWATCGTSHRVDCLIWKEWLTLSEFLWSSEMLYNQSVCHVLRHSVWIDFHWIVSQDVEFHLIAKLDVITVQYKKKLSDE